MEGAFELLGRAWLRRDGENKPRGREDNLIQSTEVGRWAAHSGNGQAKRKGDVKGAAEEASCPHRSSEGRGLRRQQGRAWSPQCREVRFKPGGTEPTEAAW